MHLAAKRVVDPQGCEWVVRRRWVHRKLRWRGKGSRTLDLMDGADLVSWGSDLPVIGVVFAVFAIVLFIVAAVILIVPALIFLAELVILAALVGLGLAGRLLFGKPWTVEARRRDGGETFQWKATGWRTSRDLVGSVADQLRSTGVPDGGVPVPVNTG